jgi:hypothetical protein
MAYSTISVSPAVKKKLESFRVYRRETYDELLERLMEDARLGDDEGEYTEETIRSLKQARAEIKAGKTIPMEAVLAKYGIKAK